MDPGALAATLRDAGCVFAEEEARVLLDVGADHATLTRLVERRVAGEPLEQVIGYAEFCGLRIAVGPGVFVPRLRSGALVDLAAPGLRAGDVVVDLCCGTGAVAAALLARVAGLEVWAADLDPAAVAVARRNVAPERVLESDLYDALPHHLRGRVTAVVANAPYVPTAAIATMPPEARDHEHLVALDGGPDGLDVQRGVIAGAPGWLAVGGRVLVETSLAQAPRTAALMELAGLTAEITHDDASDGTVVVGTR